MPVTGAEAQIYEALMDKAVAVAGSVGLPIALPNVKFTPPTASGKRQAYLQATYMPNGAMLDGLPFDSDATHQGLLQLSVFWPADAGIVKPLQIAAQIVLAFAAGLWVERSGVVVHIDQKPEVTPSLQESDLVQIPVTIRWRAGIPAAD